MTKPILEFEILSKLPSPPGVAVKLLELYSSHDVSLDDLSDVICTDPTLTARIIKYANSPMFARRHEASTLKQAIMMLGSNGVKMIALSFSLTEVSTSESTDKFSFDDFWNSSLATATSAKATYHAAGLDGEIGFLVGLLLNIGQLAMYCSDPQWYDKLLGARKTNDPDLIELEFEKFGENRYELGAKVLRAWDFPEMIPLAVELFNEDPETWTNESRALALATQMSYLFLNCNSEFKIIQSFNQNLAALIGKDSEEIEDLYCSTLGEYAELAVILSYKSPTQKSLKEMEMEARLSLVELTKDLHMSNTQVRAENNDLKDMAFIDALTGLGNRRQYESIAQSEMNRCARLGHSICLIVIDVDYFKQYNDTHGHAAGDVILAGVGSRLKNALRSYDYVFRFGGDEFVVLAPEFKVENCQAIAERLRKSIETVDFDFNGQPMSVTISMGGAVYRKGDSSVVEDLFARADAALYQAKDAGRNRCVFAAEQSASAPTSNLPTAILPDSDSIAISSSRSAS